MMHNDAANNPLTILVTDAQEPAALCAIRSLGMAGHDVVAACPRRFGRPPSARSRYCADLRHAPDPWRSHQDFRNWLERLLDGAEFDAILPVGEGSMVALAGLRAQAPPEKLLLLPSDEILACCLNKVTATRLALKRGFACPATVCIDDGLEGAALERALDGMRFPATIETGGAPTPSGAYRKGRGVAVPDRAAALAILAGLASSPAGITVQEQIPGRSAGAFFLRWEDRIQMEFTFPRRDEALLAAGRQLLEALDYQGLAMMEFRRDERGRLYFLGFNGRLDGSWVAPHCWSDLGPSAAHYLNLGSETMNKIKDWTVGPLRRRAAAAAETRQRARHAAQLEGGFHPRPDLILFVCYGNICRSPFAEAYWNARRRLPGGGELPPARSTGFYPEPGRACPAWIQDLAAEHGVDLSAHRSGLATRRLVDEAGAIFVMDAANERAMLNCFPDARERVFYLGAFAQGTPLEIADPFLAEEDQARACYRQMAGALEGLREALAGGKSAAN